MRPTTLAQLLTLAFGAFGIVLVLVELADSKLHPAPIPLVATVAAAGVAVLIIARSLLIRLEGRPRSKPVLPIGVARMAALGIAASLTGALVGGGWTGLLVDRLSRIGTVSAATRDSVVAALGVLSGLLLATAGQRLQRVCRGPS